jgi:hypothetical protein
MNIKEIIIALENGYKVYRQNWGYSPDTYIILKDHYNGKFTFMGNKYKNDKRIYGYCFEYNDLIAQDWMIYE